MHGHQYLVALGSNCRHVRFGSPYMVVRHAIAALADCGEVQASSQIITSAPLGPSRRRYVNAAVSLASGLEPAALLDALKQIERDFGRRDRGMRWRARVLDLDIIAWSGGSCRVPGLTIPHASFARRTFVLGPVASIAPRWRDPQSGLNMIQLFARLTRPRAVPSAPRWSGP